MQNRSIRRLVGTGLAAGGLTLGVLAGPVASGAVSSKAGSTLTVALPVGSVPTSVFPFYSAAQCTTTNIDYWQLTTRPGYWFGLGSGTTEVPSISPLNQPTFHTVGPNTVASFSTKGWKWSNGTSTATMTARSVAFWINMDKAQRNAGANASCGFAPGFGFPDQIVSVTYPGGLGGNAVTVTFAGHPSAQWLLYNELSQIVPLAPAWDTTNGSNSAGCSTEAFAAVTEAGHDACSNVFTYLSGIQINDPIWKWADGPYRQQSAEYSGGNPDGNDVQIANTDYSGPVKAQAAKTVVYKPYTDLAPEIADLQANKLDFGFVDPTDVTKAPGPGKAGANKLPNMTNYKTVGTVTYGVFYWMFNFNDHFSTFHTAGHPTWASLNNQTYFRQALQVSDNQATVIAHVDNGYAAPTFSAIPTYPHTPFSAGVTNPFPYSATRGKLIMKAHGWNVTTSPATCAKSNCGTAANPIPKGTKATEIVLVPSGDPAVTQLTGDEVNSILKGSGIKIVPKYELATTVQAACFGGAAIWELCGYGGWIYAPDFYPSGEVLFGSGSSSISGGFVSSEMNALIKATTTNGNLALNAKSPRFHTSFAEFTATDEPFLWQPTPTGFIEQAKSVVGAQPPSPLANFNPEYITSI